MHSGKFTKIVATLGPASESEEVIKKMILAGVNVFRFNMKHNTVEWHLNHIDLVQKIADSLKIRIGILIDLQGPEIRIETFNQKDISLEENDEIFLIDSFDSCEKENLEKSVRLSHDIVLRSFDKGDNFSIEDGFYSFEVTEKISETIVKAKILNKGIIKNRKSLNINDKDLELPTLISEDLDKLSKVAKSKIDFVALSFVGSKKDIDILKFEMDKRDFSAKIVAKIESQKALDNIDEIIKVSDAIMIARGDLGIETPLEKITYLQKEIISKCRSANTPVIVATQMLQSMIKNPIPTRAEAADVANSAYDSTDATMLSEETATGLYPVKTVETMAKILKYNERKSPYLPYLPLAKDQTHSLVSAGLKILENDSGTDIDKVIILTESGYTARVFSAYRPKVPVIAVSNNVSTVENLTLSYGILPHHMMFDDSEPTDPGSIVTVLKEFGYLEEGDSVLILHGKRWMDTSNTNALVVLEV